MRRRLRPMGLGELTCRGRQEATKWLERTGGMGRTAGPPDCRLDLDRFRVVASDRFFPGAVSEQTPSLLETRVPGARRQAVSVADAICRGRFDLLGYRELDFGDPIDWQLDPVSGRRAPRVHWSRLDPLDASAVGDSKVIWELNRHQWLVRLALAYRLTREERYANAVARHLRHWMRANPPGLGINWASSLEVALRLMSWCWTLVLLRDATALSPDLFVQLRDGIWKHAAHVERYLSYYFSPNTHLTGEALGLFYAGVLFPEWRRAPRWRALGTRILVRQSRRQILSDGVYFELSTCYQRYTVEIYLHFLILARRNAVAVPQDVEDRLRRMLDFLLAVRRPDGSVPQIGDGDGGWLLPLESRPPDDLRGVFAPAAALLLRSDCAWAAGAPTAEVLWLLGSPGLGAFETLRLSPPPIRGSRLFPQGGFAVMRSGFEPDAHHLIFDVGPLGCPVSGGHGHADLLSLQCSVFGEPYLADPGTYCYTADATWWRDFFRSTAAHSTVVVDGAGQATPAGPFAWTARPRARLREWRSTATFDFADAEHDAYRELPDPVRHRRRVVFVKPRYWVVLDELDGAGEHRVELRFQFAPMPVTVDAALWARASGAGTRALLIRPFAQVSLKAEVIEGEIAPMQGWISPDYGRRRPAPALIYSVVTALPLRILTLLLPVEDPRSPEPAVAPLRSDGRGPTGLVFDDTREGVRFDDQGIIIVRPRGLESAQRGRLDLPVDPDPSRAERGRTV